MHLSFCVGWLRTEENQLLTMSVDEARRLPRRTQELLGYGAHDAIDIGGGYLGTVDLQDPVEMMATGKLCSPPCAGTAFAATSAADPCASAAFRSPRGTALISLFRCTSMPPQSGFGLRLRS
ncbi:hypothetical protein ACU686_16180 [Yinghuangia aomiensis]